MISIGIRAHDVAKTDPYTLAKKIKYLGFDGVQLVFKKALDSKVDFTKLDDLADAFKDLNIMMLGAYFNPVHPNQQIVDEGIEYFKKHLMIANQLNASYVGSETGSLMGSPWGYVPENHSVESLEKVISVFKQLVSCAEQYDSCVAIEGAYNHVAYSPERISQILNRIHSQNLKVTVDLYNYLNIDNYQNRMDILEHCFKLFRDDIVIYHLKDFVIEEGTLKQVGLGRGLMDFKEIVKRIKKETPNAYLIFEGVTGDDIIDSVELINKLIKE